MKEDWVKAKYHDIIASTEKAVLFLFEEKEIWLIIIYSIFYNQYY